MRIGKAKKSVIDSTAKKIAAYVAKNWKVDAIYLYGSRARGKSRKDSDWDIGIMFTRYLNNKLARVLRPQLAKAKIEREFNLTDRVDVVDVEIVPFPLQYNIIQGLKLYDRKVLHVKRVENAIYSKKEIDYGG